MRIRDVTQAANDGSALVVRPAYQGAENAPALAGSSGRPTYTRSDWALPVGPSNQERPRGNPTRLQTMLFSKIQFRQQRSRADVTGVRKQREQRTPFGESKTLCRKRAPDAYNVGTARTPWIHTPASWARRNKVPHHQRAFAY